MRDHRHTSLTGTEYHHRSCAYTEHAHTRTQYSVLISGCEFSRRLEAPVTLSVPCSSNFSPRWADSHLADMPLLQLQQNLKLKTAKTVAELLCVIRYMYKIVHFVASCSQSRGRHVVVATKSKYQASCGIEYGLQTSLEPREAGSPTNTKLP